MSAAAASSLPPRLPHRLPGHPVVVPRVVLRNQALLVPAELRLALLLYDRMEREERFVPLADEEWTRYSGLDARSKELAIRGLKQKGLLMMDGIGQKARYCTDTRSFMRWASEADRSVKPRTAGRAVGVTPKPGARVHPECAARGCSRLLPETSSASGVGCGTVLPVLGSQISLAFAPKVDDFAKPVSRQDVETAPADSHEIPENPGDTRRPRHLKRKLAAARVLNSVQKEINNTQVSDSKHIPLKASGSDSGSAAGGTGPQTSGRRRQASACVESSHAGIQVRESDWPLTLARLARCGPLVDVRFLARLLAVVRARFVGVTDTELCQAIDLAALPKVKYQKSVGLFLETVPAMLARTRLGYSPPADQPTPGVLTKFPADFREYFGVFVAAGKALNAGDMEGAAAVWRFLAPADRAGAVADAREVCMKASAADFVPFPVNHLRSEGWKRTALPRTLPRITRKQVESEARYQSLVDQVNKKSSFDNDE